MSDIANAWWWLGFSVFLIVAFSVDLFSLNHSSRERTPSVRHALLWTTIWIMAALLFNGMLWLGVYLTQGVVLANQAAVRFFTGYLIEKSLSIDNLFAFYVIFRQFHIPLSYQQRIFSYGIISAVILRLLLILAGSYVVHYFHGALYLMGAFLLFMGIKIVFEQGEPTADDLSTHWLYGRLKRYFRIDHELHGGAFVIKKNGFYYLTPLCLALIFIELNDVLFALDSIPAIFAITTDPFIIWTSNIFAILGLRALYFVMAAMVERMHLVKYGIACILIYIGVKMLIAPWIAIPVAWSLGVIVCLLSITIGLSLLIKPSQDKLA